MKHGLFAELKRRHVYRVGAAYAVVGWLLIEVATQVFPVFHMPDWAPQLVIFLIVLGFPITLVMAWAFEVTPEGVRRTEPIDSPEAHALEHHRKVGRTLDFVIISVLVLALALSLWRPWSPRSAPPIAAPTASTAGGVNHASSSITKSATPASVATASSAIPAKSIAVLPLANDSGDKSQQYFSDGLSENLIIALSQFPGLKVIGRDSSFRFRHTTLSARKIGRELGVAHLLEGSVQRAGNEVRISAELINAADGSTLWSQHYDRPYKNLFALQDAITRAVADALKAKLFPGPKAQVQSDRPPSGNLAAYKAYLQGKFHAARIDEKDMVAAIAKFEQATRLDPGYAEAWSQLAETRTNYAGFYLDHESARRVYAQARVAADRALELSPDLADAHLAKGMVLYLGSLDWHAAKAEFRHAMQLAPDSADAKSEYADTLAALGDKKRALSLIREALRTDPLDALFHADLARSLFSLGDLDAAEAAMRKALTLQPSANVFRGGLVKMMMAQGNAKAALAEAEKMNAGGWRDTAMALALQIGSDHAAADAALEKLIHEAATSSAYQIAEIYAVRNDPDHTFYWLDRAWKIRDPGLALLLSDPLIDRFRKDPRFAAFCRKVGLPPPGTLARGPKRNQTPQT